MKQIICNISKYTKTLYKMQASLFMSSQAPIKFFSCLSLKHVSAWEHRFGASSLLLDARDSGDQWKNTILMSQAVH